MTPSDSAPCPEEHDAEEAVEGRPVKRPEAANSRRKATVGSPSTITLVNSKDGTMGGS